MSEGGVPAVIKKYFPNGRPESWAKICPNGPPPPELFEGDYEPGEIPPKMKALFPDGLPDDLKIFENGIPDDLKQFMVERAKEMKAKLAAGSQ